MLLMSRAEPERKVHALISEANGRGGLDNITAIVVQVAPDDDGVGPTSTDARDDGAPARRLRIVAGVPAVAATAPLAVVTCQLHSRIPYPSRRESCSCPTRRPPDACFARPPALLVLVARRPPPPRTSANKANWDLAEKFSATNLRSRVYTSAVNPRWLGQSDSLCYDWKDHTGSTFFLVVPTTKTKKPLFDQVKLAAQLSDLSHHAHDPQNLPFNSLTFSKDRKTFTFNADSSRWEWDVATETLKRLGPATPAGGAGGRGGRGGRGGGGGGDARRRRRPTRRTPAAAMAAAAAGGGGGGGGGGRRRPAAATSATTRRTAACSPSRASTICIVVKVATKDTIQLTRDGAKNYSFGARDTLQERQQQELNDQQQQQQQDDENSGGGGGGRRRRQSRSARARERHLVAGLEGVRRHAHGSAQGRRAVPREQHREPAPDADVVQLRDAGRGERRPGGAVRLQRRATRS